MEQRMSLITLGVNDLARARRFYEEGLGWKVGLAEGEIVFLQLNGLILSLYPRAALAKDAGVVEPGGGFGGITLAHNVRSEPEVDTLLSVSLVAECDGEVVGHVAASPVTLSEGTTEWFGLGPVSVLPAWQGRGIGSALMEACLSRLRERGARGCLLVGEPGQQAAAVTPEVPVERHFECLAGGSAGQLSAGQLSSCLHPRDHAIAQPGAGQAQEALRGGAEVVGEGAMVAAVDQEAMLKLIVGAVDDGRCLAKGRLVRAIGKVAIDVGRGGERQVGHLPQGHATRPGNGLGVGAEAGRHRRRRAGA